MLMKIKPIPPVVKNNGAPFNKEPRSEHSNAILAAASADLSEMGAKPDCDTARFGPFGFRINVKPGRSPRFTYRILRKQELAGRFRTPTILNSSYL